MIQGVRCSKCGLMQLPKSVCKACGSRLDVPAEVPVLRSSSESSRQTPSVENPPSPAEMGFNSEPSRVRGRVVSFYGQGGSLFEIWIVNTLLTIATLGIYHFWGKVRIRQYLFGETEFEGDRFAYHGTGKELLTGALRALVVFIIPLFLIHSVPNIVWPGPATNLAVSLATYAMFILFIPVAMVGSRRYRLSRTSWRGIRFSFRGRMRDFLKLFLWSSFLSAITLGIYNPFFEAKRYRFMVSHSYFGSRGFHFDGSGRELLKSYLFAFLLTLPTLGLSWFWYLAKRQRFFWEHTTFDETLHFHSSVTGRAMMNFYVGNFLILVVTLGLGWPWIVVRSCRFVCKYLSQEGSLDLAAVEQEAQEASATGEALSGFLDTGLDFGTG